MIRIIRALAGAAAIVTLFAWPAVAGAAAHGSAPAPFAVVDGIAISAAEFESSLRAAIRQQYYHRQPREEQLVALRREVADDLVNRLLLLREGRRRGISPNDEKVRADFAALDKRYAGRPQWRDARAEVVQALEEQSIVAQLEAAIRATPPPTDADLRGYYRSHREQFTEPERVRLAIILLKVDPAAAAAAWDEAHAKAKELVKQLAAGADFAELARRHSGDSTAREGGDLGYRHRGTLPAGVETVIGKLAPGAFSEPVRLLEGIAVFRFIDRKAPRLRSLEDVRGNVAKLWARERGETQWHELIVRLRAGAEIRINGLPLRSGAVSGAAAGGPAAR